jgi:hypothetical protein
VTVFIVGHLCFVSNLTYTKLQIRFKFDVFYPQYTVPVRTMFVSAYDLGRISDPYSIRSVDLDLYSESGSGSRRVKK